eukprot:6175983-Pleurochrysis_carterae.AAC.1
MKVSFSAHPENEFKKHATLLLVVWDRRTWLTLVDCLLDYDPSAVLTVCFSVAVLSISHAFIKPIPV